MNTGGFVLFGKKKSFSQQQQFKHQIPKCMCLGIVMSGQHSSDFERVAEEFSDS